MTSWLLIPLIEGHTVKILKMSDILESFFESITPTIIELLTIILFESNCSTPSHPYQGQFLGKRQVITVARTTADGFLQEHIRHIRFFGSDSTQWLFSDWRAEEFRGKSGSGEKILYLKS